MKATQYEDINKILDVITNGLVEIFGDNLVGVYLTGSLSYGDFIPGRSDIDIFGVLKKSLSDIELEKVKSLHQKVEDENKNWAKRIESQYIPIDMLQNILPPKEGRPYLGAGVFHPNAKYGNEWLINNYFLYHYAVALFGPEFKTLMKPIDMLDVQKASARDLFKEWVPKLKDTEFFKNSHYHSYIILNLCRILYTVLGAKIGSKKVSAKWVKNEYPEWKHLIETAERWEHGMEMRSPDETKEFIKFAVEKVREKKLYL
jgi:hypothetical protein